MDWDERRACELTSRRWPEAYARGSSDLLTISGQRLGRRVSRVVGHKLPKIDR